MESTSTTKKKVIMKALFAATPVGKRLMEKFGEDNVRLGSSVEGDFVVPGPPTSFAFLFFQNINTFEVSSHSARLQRLMRIFENLIVVFVGTVNSGEAQGYAAVKIFQSTFPQCNKLLVFPEADSAANAVFELIPLICNADRRRKQQQYIQQVSVDTKTNIAPFLASCFNIPDTHANLLLDKFGSVAGVVNFGLRHSFHDILNECPIGIETANQLALHFQYSSQ